jgi:hypothetical protein
MVNLKSVFLSLIGLFVLISCGTEPTSSMTNSNDEIESSGQDFPKLRVSNSNHCSTNIKIKSISLVGYTFNDLSINDGESQSFSLSNGMNGGLTDINVNVSYQYGYNTWTNSLKVSFTYGIETHIVLKMSNGCGSRDGYLKLG